MLEWFKSLFKSPKVFIKMAVNALDLAVPFLATEIDKLKGKFATMSSTEQAQLMVDKTQEYLNKTFHLDV